MPGWIVGDLAGTDVGDVRLTRRLVALGEAFFAQPTASIPQSFGTWAETKAAYRLIGSEAVSAEAVRESHAKATVSRTAACDMVLVVQDTTCLDFTTREMTTGLGPLPHPSRSGLLLHSALALGTDGVPLGLLHQKTWARDAGATGQRHERKRKATQEKESQRWLLAETESLSRLDPGVQVVTIGDREADIYDLMRQERRAGAYLLIRAAQNRRVKGEAKLLFQSARSAPVLGRRILRLNRQDDREEREARLSLRYCRVEIEPPLNRQREALGSVNAVAILVEEEDPPEGVAPVSWLLLTTLEVETVASAWQCVTWYSCRWTIERYHYVLKSGCGVEALQLKEARRMETALSIYAVVAWRLLWLTYVARRQPEDSCEVAFEETEWRILYVAVKKTAPPADPPPLREMTRYLAQLGGFLGRKHDGEPGVKVLWRGLQRLTDMTEALRFLPVLLEHTGVVGNA